MDKCFVNNCQDLAPISEYAGIYCWGMKTHHEIDRRSLLLHRLVSRRVQSDPSLMNRVHGTVARWRRLRPESPALQEWAELLSQLDAPGVVRFLRSRGAAATRLRQSSPFVGILTEEERAKVFRRYAAA